MSLNGAYSAMRGKIQFQQDEVLEQTGFRG